MPGPPCVPTTGPMSVTMIGYLVAMPCGQRLEGLDVALAAGPVDEGESTKRRVGLGDLGDRDQRFRARALAPRLGDHAVCAARPAA